MSFPRPIYHTPSLPLHLHLSISLPHHDQTYKYGEIRGNMNEVEYFAQNPFRDYDEGDDGAVQLQQQRVQTRMPQMQTQMMRNVAQDVQVCDR